MNDLIVKGVSKFYGEKAVFKDLDITVKVGSFTTILGPSGCGKSTLLRSIAGLEILSGGSVHLGERDITSLRPQERNVGMVFQNYALFPNMNVRQNVLFGLKQKKMPKVEANALVNEMLENVGLAELSESYPSQLSGGQKQRVALARSLVVKPELLLLDEPLSALDAKMRKSLRELLLRFNEDYNLTMICVSHDQEEALSMSDEIFVMHNGKFVQTGDPEAIYTRPNSYFVADFIGSYTLINMQEHLALKAILGVSANQVAIRPEAIYINDTTRQFADHYSDVIQVKVRDSVLLGNIIRYSVIYEGTHFELDTLNRSSSRFVARGGHIDIRFDKQELIEMAGTH